MALVDYVSSDEDSDEKLHYVSENPHSRASDLKRKCDSYISDLPPLPSKFHDLYASTTRRSTVDCPSLHGGRKRTIPHVVGNWPTHIYLEWYPMKTEHNLLTNLVSSVKAKNTALQVNSFITSDLNVPLPLHISLSRPIQITTEQKDLIVTSLNRFIEWSNIRPFKISFTDLEWVSNFEKTRWFLVLRVSKPIRDELNRLLHISNMTVQKCGQLSLYTNPKSTVNITPSWKQNLSSGNKSCRMNNHGSSIDWTKVQDVSDSFHVSVAWTLETPTREVLECTKSVANEYLKAIAQLCVKFENVKIKIGNTVVSNPLTITSLEGKGSYES